MEVTQKTRKRSNKKIRDEVLEVLVSVPNSSTIEPSFKPSSFTFSMEDVLERRNLQEALKRVINNKGCAGVDGMEVQELPEFLKENWLKIKSDLLTGKYKPRNILRAYIPKRNMEHSQIIVLDLGLEDHAIKLSSKVRNILTKAIE